MNETNKKRKYELLQLAGKNEERSNVPNLPNCNCFLQGFLRKLGQAGNWPMTTFFAFGLLVGCAVPNLNNWFVRTKTGQHNEMPDLFPYFFAPVLVGIFVLLALVVITDYAKTKFNCRLKRIGDISLLIGRMNNIALLIFSVLMIQVSVISGYLTSIVWVLLILLINK